MKYRDRHNSRAKDRTLAPLRALLLSLLVGLQGICFAQFSYEIDQSIPVSGPKGTLLSNAWAGGLNATQFNTMDLNGDGKEDLVLFDRMVNRITTFLNVAGQWKYSPQFEILFPEDVTNWVLLKDFNCDGKKDIFTGDNLGVKVYRNVTAPGGKPAWKRFMFYSENGIRTDILLTKGFVVKTNLQLQYDDLPTIVDADNDGDLDIFNVRFTGNGSVEYHKNLSRERYGVCDSLDFERQTNTWGGFTQCKCERFAYGDRECTFTGGRVQHGGGKALLAIDTDDDGDHELLFSEAECPGLYALVNNGTITNPVVTSNFPYPPSRPVAINIFPAAFHEDLDMDGLKDLVATPNIYRKDLLNQDLKASTWFYKNTGTARVPDFRFVKKDFLQDRMIDVGDNSVPAFIDIDGDSDLDLFISENSDSTSSGSITFYENTGSSIEPAFKFQTDDFISFRSLGLNNVRIQFSDVNADGISDMCFMGSNAKGTTELFYLKGHEGSQRYDIADLQRINVPITFQDNFHFTDADHDGRIDVIVIRTVGSLEFWRNTGPRGFPSFSMQDPAFLGYGASTGIRTTAICTADLDNDGTQDMVLSDQYGNLCIIPNYHENENRSAVEELIYNPLIERYTQTSLGRGFPTTAKLFNSTRPAIVTGNVKGGLHVLRNEEKDLKFDDLLLQVWPNPASTSEGFTIESNLPITLDIYNTLGQVVQSGIGIFPGRNNLSTSLLAPGIYILRFGNGRSFISRKIIMR